MLYIILGIVVGVLLLFTILFFTPIPVTIIYNKDILTIRMFGIRVFSSAKKSNKDTKNKPKSNFIKIPKPSAVKDLIINISNVYNSSKDEILMLFKQINKIADIKIISGVFNYGFGDAAITAISYGTICGIIGNVIAEFSDRLPKLQKKLSIAISPIYDKKCFDVLFTIKLRMSIRNTFKAYKETRNTIEDIKKIIKL